MAESKPPRKPVDKNRLAEIFGDVLPDTTTDERDPHEADASSDDWHRNNVPPHHS
ncbi:MAG: hypothetical protein HOQ24_01195 [Mycobacteriaceae bacterium]|nr:hypothetical protein [Mycobacteriaceae bacterium]